MPTASNRGRFAAGLGAQTKKSRGTVKSEISEYDSEDEDRESEEDYDSEEEGEESNEEESSYAMTTEAKKSPK